jgi:hypothetical protein
VLTSWSSGVADPGRVKRFDRTLQVLRDLPYSVGRLDAVRRWIAEMEDLEAATVAAARAAGVTWTQIGALYGLSQTRRPITLPTIHHHRARRQISSAGIGPCRSVWTSRC